MIWHDEYFATAGRAEPHFGGAGFTREDWAPMLDLVSGWDVPTDLYCLPPLHVATIHDGFFSFANCLPVPGLLPHVPCSRANSLLFMEARCHPQPSRIAPSLFPLKSTSDAQRLRYPQAGGPEGIPVRPERHN